MTHEEAKALKSFKNLCTCGGYAWRINGRLPPNPHMHWCPQDQEYREWYAAMHPVPDPEHRPDTKRIETPSKP